MRCEPHVKFPTRKALVQEQILAMLECIVDMYVRPTIASCATTTIIFDLWVSRCGHDAFCMVVNFIDDSWMPRHVIVGLFEIA